MFRFFVNLMERLMRRKPMPLLPAGTPAPDFSLKASDGSTVTLSAHKGRQAVVLVFYCMNNTPG
jgi:peroxiredoxin Q/BCP